MRSRIENPAGGRLQLRRETEQGQLYRWLLLRLCSISASSQRLLLTPIPPQTGFHLPPWGWEGV